MKNMGITEGTDDYIGIEDLKEKRKKLLRWKPWKERLAMGGMALVMLYGLGVLKAGEYYNRRLSNYRDSLAVERSIVQEKKKKIESSIPFIKLEKLESEIARYDSLIGITDEEINDSGKNLVRALKSWGYLFE